MKLAVVGGHSRNVGKTSLACSLIRATTGLDWTAVKISQFGHGVCTTSGKACGCAVDDVKHPFSLSIEDDPEGGSDTSRLLRAGAREVLWLRSPQGRLAEAMPLLERALSGRSRVLIESNSVVDFLPPDVYVQTWNPAVADVKESCRRLLARADAVAAVQSADDSFGKTDLPGNIPAAASVFWVEPPGYCSAALVAFVRRRVER